MDQGGLKNNGNRDGGLTFGEARGRLGGDPAGLLLQPAVHLPDLGLGHGPLPLSAMVSSAGLGQGQDQLELEGFFLSGMKEGQEQQQQKQPDLDLFGMESSLLKQSIPDSTSVITTSDTSVMGNFPLPDLFPQHIKQEEPFSLDKALDAFGRNVAGPVGPGDLDSISNHLLDDLDLPFSLPEMTGFELEDEVDKILHGCKSSGAPAGAFPKDGKSGSDEGISCPDLNGTKHPVQHLPQQLPQQLQQQLQQLQPQQLQLQPGPLLSSVTIKVKKDPDPSFIRIQQPPVEVKLEKGDEEAFCLQGSVGAGLRPGYSCRESPASAVGLQEQKPFCLYPTLPLPAEGWSTGGRHGDPAGLLRAEDGGPSTTLLGTFPSSFSR